jgi:phytoene synthase
MTPADTAEITELVKRSGTSFYYGMKILPAARRDAMYAVYAFCRLVDDIADDDAVPMTAKSAALADWRARIAAVFAGKGDDAVTRALVLAVPTYRLRQDDFIAIIDGMEMDGEAIVAPTLATLDLYCDRVAAAVGRLSVRIFGDGSNQAQDVAYALGRALQLTNILRDVPEDAARGRLYLPFEYLSEAGVPTALPAALAHPALPKVCARLAALAERNFREADSAMAMCDARAMRPARLMAASYRPLLRILRNRGFNYARPRVSLPKWRKLALAGRLLFS